MKSNKKIITFDYQKRTFQACSTKKTLSVMILKKIFVYLKHVIKSNIIMTYEERVLLLPRL